MKRFLFDIILFLALVMLPWQISFLLALVFLFYFKNYIEIIFFGLFFDIIYGGDGLFDVKYNYIFFTIFLLLWAISFKVKEVLRR